MRHHAHSSAPTPTGQPPKQRPDSETIQRLFPYLWQYKWRVVAALSFMMGAKVANVSVPLLLKELEASVPNYYRVGGETYFGYEGATSAIVNSEPAKFVPSAPEAIQTATTPWQVKLNWKPADAKYFGAYRIYQKDGDA